MFIDGAAYPLHLAISGDWKVHYFTAAMVAEPAFRLEERRFLDDMPAVLGARAMVALSEIQAILGLHYAGTDFGSGAGRIAAVVRGQRDNGGQPAGPESDVGLSPSRHRRRTRGGAPHARPTCREHAMNDTAIAQAISLHQAGRLSDAATLYRSILEREPNHADSLHLLGLITAETDNPQAGIVLIRRAMAAEPDCAPHHNSLGHAYRRLGRLEDAVASYRDAAALRPGSAEIHNNLATALCDLGRWQEAIDHYRQAAAAAPDIADIWYNLANVLAETGSPEADTCYQVAAELQPGSAPIHGNYGRWLMTQGRWAEAEAHLSEAVGLAPAQAENWNNLGVVRREFGRPDLEACFREALAINPKLADAHYNLGCVLSGDLRTDEAIACHQAALSVDPGFAKARLAACMAQLTILYRSQEEIADRRQRYATALQDLETTALADAIGSSQPFFLPYQGQNDRSLQAAYGRLACRALAGSSPPVSSPPQGNRIRIGVVSGFFCDHTLFKLFLEGWLTGLDRGRFEIVGFHTGRLVDATTARCAALCDTFVQGLPTEPAWREAIVAHAPHVLLYPEVGIDPIAGRLAAQRLARVQCVTWGQPETTGMPTIDAFLSSELMEPPDGEAHYTEKLVRLPDLGSCYVPDGDLRRRRWTGRRSDWSRRPR